MIKEIGNHLALTELYLKSTKPIKEEEFDSQFEHLSTQDKKGLKIFKRNKQAFSQQVN
jgi:hypothetical protein